MSGGRIRKLNTVCMVSQGVMFHTRTFLCLKNQWDGRRNEKFSNEKMPIKSFFIQTLKKLNKMNMVKHM
jgi:hypothetical protein